MTKGKFAAAAMVIGALALPAGASANNLDKATGGGQVVFSADGTEVIAAVDDVTAWCLLAFVVSIVRASDLAHAGLTTLLTLLQMPEGARRILFGLIILFVTTAYLRLTDQG